MKIVLQLLFLLFYVASSYVVTQERTMRSLGECLEVFTQAPSEIDSESRPYSKGLPKFGQAKPKAGSDAWFAQAVPGHRLEIVLERPAAQRICYKDLLTFESLSSRSPPLPL
jgi:hypothetical protein